MPSDLSRDALISEFQSLKVSTTNLTSLTSFIDVNNVPDLSIYFPSSETENNQIIDPIQEKQQNHQESSLLEETISMNEVIMKKMSHVIENYYLFDEDFP